MIQRMGIRRYEKEKLYGLFWNKLHVCILTSLFLVIMLLSMFSGSLKLCLYIA
jgi:hypothetical protein